MSNIKEMISKVIVTRPDTLQFAKDRKYEEAWIIGLNKSKPSEEEINTYIKKDKFETIIVEYIWNSEDDNNRFVLTLFLDRKCKLQDPKVFVDINLELFYHYSDFSSFITAINDKIIGLDYLLLNTVDSVNVSIFNYWLSVGPVDLWQKGDVYNLEQVKAKIQSRPEIEKTTLNYQGLLFRFNVQGTHNGPYYGIKTPCCNKIDNEWVIDHDKVDYWMKVMLDENGH